MSPPDFSIHRACFTLLRNLVTIWHQNGNVLQNDPQVKQFVMVEVTTQLFKSLCAPHFELAPIVVGKNAAAAAAGVAGAAVPGPSPISSTDAGCISAIRELLELQKTIYKSLGDSYLSYLSSDFLCGLLQFPQEVGKEYCRVLVNYQTNNNQAGNEWKQFEGFFRMLQARNKQTQQQGSAPSTPTGAGGFNHQLR